MTICESIFLKFKNIILFISCLSNWHFSNSQSLLYKQYDSDFGINTSEIFDITQDKYGQMWFATNVGVSSFNFNKFKNWGINEGLPVDIFTKIFFDNEEILWVLTLNNGLYYFDDNKQRFYSAVFNKSLKKIIKRNVINQLEIDNTGKFWLIINHEEIVSIYKNKINVELKKDDVPKGYGFFKYKINKNQSLYGNLNAIEYKNKNKALIIEKHNAKIKKFYFDKPINIHGPIGLTLSDGNEIISYKNELIFFKNNKIINRISIGDVFIMKIFKDNHENLWLCTQGGLLKVSKINKGEREVKKFFRGQNITSLFRDYNNSIWLGSVGYGIYAIKNINIFSYLNDEKIIDIRNFHNQLYISSINGKLYKYTSDSIILLSNKKDIEIRSIDTINNKILLYYSTYNNKLNFKNSSINFLEAKKGVIAGKKLYSIVNTILQYDLKLNKIKEIVFESKTTSIAKINGNSLLVGTTKGLFELDLTKHSKKYFINNEVFLNHAINNIVQDELNYYIGINNKGVYCINKQDKKFKIINDNKDKQIVKIIVESNNNIWVCYNNGCYNYKTDIFNNFRLSKSFTKKTDLIKGDIYGIEKFNNEYFIYTSKGFYKISKNEKENDNYKICVSSFNIENSNKLINPTINKNLKLLKDERNIEIELSVCAIIKPEKIIYKFGEVGENANVYETGSSLINIANLKNGKYKFETVGNYTKNVSLIFTIQPYFTETIWFYLILILLIFLISGIIIWQIIKNQKISKNLLLNQLFTMQTKLNPHFIFNSLNSMQNIYMSNHFEAFNKYLTSFSDMMRKCYNFSTEEFIVLSDEISFNENYLKMEKLNYDFDYDIIIEEKINIYRTKIPPLFIQPLLENCIKHGLKNADKKYCKITFKLIENYNLIEIVVENEATKSENIKFYRKNGSLGLLKERIDNLKKLNKNKNISLVNFSENNKTISIIKLPYKYE